MDEGGHHRGRIGGRNFWTFADHLQLGTLLRSKRKLEELSNVIQEQRRQTGH